MSSEYSSITERNFSRSVHFTGVPRETAVTRAAVYQERIGSLLAGLFHHRDAYQFERVRRYDADCTYTIRKGSAALTVNAVFGTDTSYKDKPPRKFYTFTATASHHNEVLDQAEQRSGVIEWTCRIAGALALGIPAVAAVFLVRGVFSGQFILLGVGGGIVLGGLIGEGIARDRYNRSKRRLERKGEVTAVEHEWNLLTAALAEIFDHPPDIGPGE